MVEEQFCELTELMDVLEVARLARLARLDAARVGDADHAGSTAGWVREATLVSPNAAGRAVRLARDLRALPQLAAAVGDGRVSVEHARVIAGLRKDLPDPAVLAALPSLIEAAMGCTPLELGRWVADVRHSYAPERVRVTEVTQYEARSVDTAVTFQGVGDGRWVLPPVLHETVMTALHAFSKPVVGDDRSPAQRRADALVTIAELALASGQAPEAGGVRPHVSLLVSLETLERRVGAPAAHYGYGATSSMDWARRMCCDAGLSRLVHGPAGEVLDAGRTTRTFTPAMRRAIVARDRGCVWPHCDRPASWCEAHHRKHWADGGETSVENGVLLCGRHHDRVHLHNLRVLINPDGSRTVDTRRCSDGLPVTRPPWDPRERPPSADLELSG